MSYASIPDGAGRPLQTCTVAFDSTKNVVQDPLAWTAHFRVVLRFLFFLLVMAPPALFLFASFRFASAVLLGVGTISLGWLGMLAAMLAFDCLPEAALTVGPLGLACRDTPAVPGAAAATEFGPSLFLNVYLLYSVGFWVFALALFAVAARLLLI